MTEMTVTEALAELKTIEKRLEKKRPSVLPFLVRDSRITDPLKRGSETFVREVRQSVTDLEARYCQIRTAIQNVNLVTRLTLNGEEKTVANWLVWKREVAPKRESFLCSMHAHIKQAKATIQAGHERAARELRFKDPSEAEETAPPNVLVCVDEEELIKDIEAHEKLTGDLDGKLSLLNATTRIKIPD